MIDRYVLPEMAALWSDRARLDRWLEVEILATEAFAAIGIVPLADARAVRDRASFTVEAVNARELLTDHDVAAFVDVVQESVGGDAGKWVHYGLTSTDVVDTALSVALVAAADLLIEAASRLIVGLATRARELATVPVVGRTHGIHAEPTTFGAKFSLWCLAVDRDRTRLRRARESIAVGKLSGAVGTYSNVDPSIEASVCAHLGLTPVPATQVIARDRHAELLYACASVGATVEMIATEVRHLQRTEVREALEPFRAGQKGSSAMPHKRNPILAERLCGLARILRANLLVGLEDIALWHERDISHSSAERVILPDSTTLAHYVLVKAATLVNGLRIDAEQAMRNLDASYGLVFSQPVLLALVDAGRTRDEAYRIVQEHAMKSWEERTSFRSNLAADPRVGLSAEALDAAFDLKRALRHAGRFIDVLEQVEGI